MKTPAIVCAIILLSIPAVAQAGERRVRHAHAPAAVHRHHGAFAARERAPVRREASPSIDPDGYPSDTPYGPRYQTQEQEMQSRYDFAAGRKGNIKEYWWRY